MENFVKQSEYGLNTCPVCKHSVGEHTSTTNFCCNCGIALDWTKVDEIENSLTKRAKAIKFCRNETTYDMGYLSNLKENLHTLMTGAGTFVGCPENYGLSPCVSLCEDDHRDKIPDNEMDEMCKRCWELALKD